MISLFVLRFQTILNVSEKQKDNLEGKIKLIKVLSKAVLNYVQDSRLKPSNDIPQTIWKKNFKLCSEFILASEIEKTAGATRNLFIYIFSLNNWAKGFGES